MLANFKSFNVRYILWHLELYSCIIRWIKHIRGVIFTPPKKIFVGKTVFDLPYIIFNVFLAIYMRKIRQYIVYLKPWPKSKMVAQSLRAKQCITGITINAKAENL
jgi:hypothetical protein